MKDQNRKYLRKTPWYCDGFALPLRSRVGWYQALFGLVYWDGFHFSWAVGDCINWADYVTWRGIAR